MEDIANAFGTIFGALAMGALCGLAPFYLGKNYNKNNLGMVGFFVCVICGFILGALLAIPVAGVFSLIIYLSGKDE